MTDVCKKPQRLAVEQIADAAQRGVARALEARKAAGVELSSDDVQQVSGGALPINIIRAGGIPPYMLQTLKSTQLVTNPTMPSTLNAGLAF